MAKKPMSLAAALKIVSDYPGIGGRWEHDILEAEGVLRGVLERVGIEAFVALADGRTAPPEDPSGGATKAYHEAAVAAAEARYGADGEIEIDPGANLSIGDVESGCFVQGWLWVDADEIGVQAFPPEVAGEPA